MLLVRGEPTLRTKREGWGTRGKLRSKEHRLKPVLRERYCHGCVEGVQPEATPAHVSRRNIPPDTDMEPRLLAEDANVM